MKQRVFGSHRTIGDELVKLAGPAAEGFEAVYPYDPTRTDPRWLDFNARYEARYHEKPDHFAALAYDQMQILLNAICRAGLNRGRIRDALTGIDKLQGRHRRDGLRSELQEHRSPVPCAVHNGTIEYRRITMEKPYAKVGENGVQYAGPKTPDENASDLKIGVFGPHADELVRSPEAVRLLSSLTGGKRLSLVAIPSESSWGKASRRSGESHIPGARARADCSGPCLQSSCRTDRGEGLRSGCSHLLRSSPDLNQHSLDLPSAGGHSSCAGFGFTLRCYRTGWSEPGEDSRVAGLGQTAGWSPFSVVR